LETQAKLRIQEEVLLGLHDLVWSSIEDYENAQNPFEIRRSSISQWKNLAVSIQMADNAVIQNAHIIMQKGIKKKDALHIASAIAAKCDAFITVDAKILKTPIQGIDIFSPITFLEYEESIYE
ncbi:MAG: PIN domain protein, partial [Spirochaetales bacterium]|nr:PIN domain protein [Spirochaetales bacterium]